MANSCINMAVRFVAMSPVVLRSIAMTITKQRESSVAVGYEVWFEVIVAPVDLSAPEHQRLLVAGTVYTQAVTGLH